MRETKGLKGRCFSDLDFPRQNSLVNDPGDCFRTTQSSRPTPNVDAFEQANVHQPSVRVSLLCHAIERLEVN